MSKSLTDKKRKLSILIGAIAVILVAFLTGINFITDLLWFKEMGYLSVFFTKMFTQLKVGVPTFIIITIIVNVYLHKLRKGYFTKIVSSEETNMKKLGRYTNLLSVLFGGIVTVYAMSMLWFGILKFTHSTDFDINDPIFGHDVSFYIFKLGFLKIINQLVIALVVLIAMLTVIYYILLLSMRTPDIEENEEDPSDYQYAEEDFSNKDPMTILFERMRRSQQRKANRRRETISQSNIQKVLAVAEHQIMFLGIVLFLMLGANFFLKQFDLLHAHRGVVYGAGYTDLTVTLWMYRILMGIAIIGAIMVVPMLRRKQWKKLMAIPVIMMAINVVGSGAAVAVQNFIVSPDEINKESQYLKRNIQFTQKAYGLNEVDVKPFAADNTLTADDIKNNNQTISNIRINDYKPVKTFYNQTQSIRQYYTFNDVDVDRYILGGELTQTYMSMREIDENKINDTWLNRHLKYTHGYGATLSRVDTITPSGQPDVMLKNIPPETKKDELKIKRPEIYFGELSNDYILVNTKEEEFDYPNGNENKYTKYQGKAGIKMNLLNRILFSIREGSLKMLVSSNIDSDAKIIIYRNVMERIKTIMPYLEYEKDPYSITVDGKMYWILDAYTTSTRYPYSEPFNGEVGSNNYIRNSVKVVVDAYDGTVDFYVVDKSDPIAKTYQKIFPKLFKDIEKMPEKIKAHLRYPNNFFEIQAGIYTRYHMNDVKVFYQKEDLWDIANQIYGTDEVKMEPNYFVVKLPGENKAEFINSLPFTPKSKNNMTALMVARNDGENYGKLVLYQFPKNKTVYGPMQIEAQIDQNTKISQDFSLWSSAGSKYSRGNLFVIPIETSLLYVEPVYLEASNSAIPEVKRVIIAYGEKIAYESTLKEALQSLFGEQAGEQYTEGSTVKTEKGTDKPKGGETVTTLIDMASKAFDDGQKSLKDGNWAEYGKHMEELQEALSKLAGK